MDPAMVWPAADRAGQRYGGNKATPASAPFFSGSWEQVTKPFGQGILRACRGILPGMLARKGAGRRVQVLLPVALATAWALLAGGGLSGAAAASFAPRSNVAPGASVVIGVRYRLVDLDLLLAHPDSSTLRAGASLPHPALQGPSALLVQPELELKTGPMSPNSIWLSATAGLQLGYRLNEFSQLVAGYRMINFFSFRWNPSDSSDSTLSGPAKQGDIPGPAGPLGTGPPGDPSLSLGSWHLGIGSRVQQISAGLSLQF